VSQGDRSCSMSRFWASASSFEAMFGALNDLAQITTHRLALRAPLGPGTRGCELHIAIWLGAECQATKPPPPSKPLLLFLRMGHNLKCPVGSSSSKGTAAEVTSTGTQSLSMNSPISGRTNRRCAPRTPISGHCWRTTCCRDLIE
jgi:hypothetical protein